MFIIKSAIENQGSNSLQEKVVEGLKKVGPNIATATIC